MGLLELILLIVIIAAVFGRGYLAMGVIFDIFIALIVIALLYRVLVAVL
jgi:hypothetical protein